MHHLKLQLLHKLLLWRLQGVEGDYPLGVYIAAAGSNVDPIAILMYPV